MTLPVPLDFPPMEARLVDGIPRDPGWQYEPKWDGFRCLAFRDGTDVRMQSKSGQPLERYFPEILAALAALDTNKFVVDGELVVSSGDALAFDILLQRIHPAASRVAKLSRDHPATFLIFDLICDGDGASLVDLPLRDRRARLERFARHFVPPEHARLRLSPATRSAARVDAWYARVGGALDGIVAKKLDAPYRSGERDAVVKVKAIRSADCIVAGYRLAERGDAIGSLLLGLYDDAGRLDYVGFTSGFSAQEKRSLLERLRMFHADASFDGNIPGGPSRWNRGKSTAWQALQPELVLEVAFDQVTGIRFRHGTRPLRWRPDKAARTCTLDQIVARDATLSLILAPD